MMASYIMWYIYICYIITVTGRCIGYTWVYPIICTPVARIGGKLLVECWLNPLFLLPPWPYGSIAPNTQTLLGAGYFRGFNTFSENLKTLQGTCS